MAFPLADWIDGHDDCRHNLAKSGMKDAIPAPTPSARDLREADPAELRRLLAEDLGVDPARVFLTTGASQANAVALLFLGRTRHGEPTGRCRVCFPEYPPLFDTARWAGFRATDDPGPVDLAVISQPRNPEGDLWERTRVLDWASDARWLLVDETFREFAGARSMLGVGRPNLWATGSFTKFFAADDLRVGFVVPPEECLSDFARFAGLVRNLLPSYSVAGALRALREREAIRKRVRAVLEANTSALRSSFPEMRRPDSPVVFDRPATGEDGDALARRALEASVLVCSGSFFGDPTGVRLCLTQRTFPADLDAYRAIRDFAAEGPRPQKGRPIPTGRTGRAVRPRPGGSGRAKAAPS
ncbi:MAG TPA: pyridoxal phosphate-dependent aminotransferase [Thermoplasmata archaeon]|nr:pyridoxal phosphate-dependent aminotransferase [Thermoplasmata archaeon]